MGHDDSANSSAYTTYTGEFKCRIMGKQRVDCLPKDVESVIINGKVVIVTLVDGRRGKSVCGFKDEFDPYVGFCIALQKARTTNNFKLKQVLIGCIESAKSKGYAQAILKNYDDEKTVIKQLTDSLDNKSSGVIDRLR